MKKYLEYEIDMGSDQKINSPKYLLISHQTEARDSFPNRGNNISIFDQLNVGNYHVVIDGIQYPKEKVVLDHESNDYFHQKGDLESFQKKTLEKK